MYQTKCINYYNIFPKQFDRNEYFSPFEFSSARIKIGVWINSARLNNFGLAFIQIRCGSGKVRCLICLEKITILIIIVVIIIII